LVEIGSTYLNLEKYKSGDVREFSAEWSYQVEAALNTGKPESQDAASFQKHKTMPMYKTIRPSCVVLSILCYFFCFAGRGLQADFSHDDLMNIYKCWYPPVTQHVAETIAFFTFSESYRPVGSLFYRLLFETYGMQALPYRMACYGLLLLNLWLAYCVVRRLVNSVKLRLSLYYCLRIIADFGLYMSAPACVTTCYASASTWRRSYIT